MRGRNGTGRVVVGSSGGPRGALGVAALVDAEQVARLVTIGLVVVVWLVACASAASSLGGEGHGHASAHAHPRARVVHHAAHP